MHKIWLFVGTAVASAQNASGCPAGEQHAIIVFLRQPRGSEADFEGASTVARDNGWKDVDLERAGTLEGEPLSSDPDEIECYQSALEYGHAIMVFSDPI